MQYLLIFDVDGTLLDSERTIIRCMIDSARKYGYVLEMKRIKENIGVLKLMEILEKNGVDKKDIPGIMDHYNDCVLSSLTLDTVPKPDSFRVLKKLQESNDLAILTLKNRVQTLRILAEFFPGINFSYVVCGDEPIMNKNEGIEMIVDKSKRERNKIFYIGDRASDVKSALDSGIGAVWVSFGLGKANELDSSGHFLVANSFGDLLTFFKPQT
jgi:phosphoglycolate phosphatase-like HAD superfamily hydrolase